MSTIELKPVGKIALGRFIRRLTPPTQPSANRLVFCPEILVAHA